MLLKTFFWAFSSAKGFAKGTNAPNKTGSLDTSSAVATFISLSGSWFPSWCSSASVIIASTLTSVLSSTNLMGLTSFWSSPGTSLCFSFLSFLLLCTPSLSERFSFFACFSLFLSSLFVDFSLAIAKLWTLRLGWTSKLFSQGLQVVCYYWI